MAALRNSIVMMTVLAAGVSAQAATVATFADPSQGPTPSMFSWNATTNTLSGGWGNTGLDLLTPGTTAPDYLDATFAMTPLVATGSVGNVFTFGMGSIQFFDNLSQPIFKIEFQSARMLYGAGFGSSSFLGDNVTFSGAALGTFISIQNEQFSFGFVNLVAGAQSSFTSTAAFTSSADIVIPSPASLGLMGGAMLLASRRRR